jgi:hypothetical protein
MEDTNKNEMPEVSTDGVQASEQPSEQMSSTQELKPASSGSSRSQMMVGLIILVVLALLGGLGYYLYSQSQSADELDTDEKLEEFADRSSKAIVEFDGVITSVVKDGATGQEASVEYDFESEVARFGGVMIEQLFGQSSATVEEVLLSNKGSALYIYDGDEWFVYSQDANITELSIAETLEDQVAFDPSYTEYKGIVDCPESSGSCYLLEITRDAAADVYFDVDSAYPVYVELGDGSTISYEFDSRASIEVPDDATELSEDDPFFLELFGGASGINEEGSSDDFEDDFGDFDDSDDFGGFDDFSDEELENLSDEELQDLLEEYLNEGI